MGVLEKFFEELFGARPPPARRRHRPRRPPAVTRRTGTRPAERSPRGLRRRCRRRPRQDPQPGRGGFEAVAAQPARRPPETDTRQQSRGPANPVVAAKDDPGSV